MLYVDIPTLAEFRVLAETRADICLSIYLPTTPLPQESAAARTELSNLARKALSPLADTVGRRAARARLDALRESVADLGADDEFWRYQAHSLAVLGTPDVLHTFRLPNRLSVASEVADRFYLKPLVRAITFPYEAFVLALAENAVRLVEVSADLPARTINIADLPKSAADAVRRSTANERSPRGRLQGTEGQKILLTQYARQVDAALRPVLAGSAAPVIWPRSSRWLPCSAR